MTISLVFRVGYLNPKRHLFQGWRPAVVFAKLPKTDRLYGLIDTVVETQSREKQYHHWQQSLELCRTLFERLTRPGDTVLDPHLGTGTNAVACSLLGDRHFIGCDIDKQQVKTARYRVAHEGQQKSA